MGPWRRRCDRSCPANALVDVPSSRTARAGGPSGRTAYGYPSSLAGSSLRSPCSFSPRVFRRRPRDYARPAARAAQTSARATRPFRLLQAWRVAPSSDPRSAHNTHVPARKRMRPAHVRRARVARPLEGPRREHAPRPVASYIATRRAGTSSCVAAAGFLQRFDGAPVLYPRNNPRLTFTTRGGRTGSPACSRSSRCACNTRTIDRQRESRRGEKKNVFIVLLSCYFHPQRHCGACSRRGPSRGRAPRGRRPRASFSFAQDRARRGPRGCRRMTPRAMPGEGDRAESRAHSVDVVRPQGGHNLVGGA